VSGDEVPRDQWGRPLIVPEGGGKPVPYTRISTLAKALDNGNALAAWKQRMTALGLVRRPDLLALVRTYSIDDRKQLDNICEQALVAAGGESRANMGTAIHSLTEQIDRGQTPEFLDPELERDIDAYVKAILEAKLTPVVIEQFVVNDELQVAGTFDRIYRTADGRYLIGDIKTGDTAHTYGLGAVQIQTASYGRGRPYSVRDGRGKPLSDLGLSLEEGLLVHLPAGSGQCTIYRLNLEQGWVDAQLASTVHRRTAAARKWTPVRYN
jgi:hypothetical protein